MSILDQDDVIIIGGGPVGIFGMYQAGLRQLRARLIESLPELGGQVSAMYPEKYIYDVGGFPKITGRDLVEQVSEQSLHGEGKAVSLNEKVEGMRKDGDGWLLTTSKGERRAKAIIITAGIGAFKPKSLGLEEEERFEGKGVYYFVRQLSDHYGKRIVIVGAGDSAVDWANTFRGKAEVTLIHRSDRFRAHPEAVKEMTESGEVQVKIPHRVVGISGDGRVESIRIEQLETHEETELPCDVLLICIGFNTDLGPMKSWGLEMKGGKIVVDSEMKTNVPGIFAAGDVNTYPGKLNLIALGFGEVAIAMASAVGHLNPGKRAGLAHSSSRGY